MSKHDGHAAGTADHALVLHVDDEPAVSELVVDQLEHLDDSLTVLTAQNADEGLERLSEEPVDCVVSDYDMPGDDGVEFLRAVRDEYPNLPFVLFTGRGNETVASEAIEAGVTDYIRKSGTESYELLHARIRNAVSKTRAERRAKLARDQLHEIFEHINGFFAVDDDWTVTYWNERMAERTGYPPEAVVGEQLWDAYPELVGTTIQELLYTLQESREPLGFEEYVDSEDQWLEINAYPVEGGVFVQSQDVTDKRERVRELERRNQRLESVARTLSHDLQNPLNVAEGRLELAEETGELTHLTDVANAHNQMQNLINELLRLARAEEIEMSEVDLRETVEESWSFADTGATALDVRFDGLTVLADKSQLQRIFENLFENATEHGGASVVTVGVLDGTEGFYVEDDGRGLPDESVDIFESGVTTAAKGTGYGLAIVDQIATEHGWTVRATASESGGARFEVTDLESV
ncbi:MAG: response regulator [Halobacteriaceae archaeon]